MSGSGRQPGFHKQLCSCLITLLFRLIPGLLFILEAGTAECSPGTLHLASGRKLLVEGGNHFPYKDSLATRMELGGGPSAPPQASRLRGHHWAVGSPWIPDGSDGWEALASKFQGHCGVVARMPTCVQIHAPCGKRWLRLWCPSREARYTGALITRVPSPSPSQQLPLHLLPCSATPLQRRLHWPHPHPRFPLCCLASPSIG